MLKISKKDYATLENEIHDEIRKTFLKFVDDGKITLSGRSTPPRPRGRPRKKKPVAELPHEKGARTPKKKK